MKWAFWRCKARRLPEAKDKYTCYRKAHPEYFELMQYRDGTCGTCRWWGLENMSHSHIAEWSDGSLHEMITQRVTGGTCRRHAPQSNGRDYAGRYYGFPPTSHGDTCGDWEAKVDSDESSVE